MVTVTRWLDVEVGGEDINLNTIPSDVALIDIHNDNEVKLMIGDLGGGEETSKLKVFKGAMQTSDIVLPDLPLGVVGFYPSETIPRCCPFIGIAFSSSLYIYRNMKLFYKYYLPSDDLSSKEMLLWKQLIDPVNHEPDRITDIIENLKNIPKEMISSQSKNILTLTLEQQLEYLEQHAVLPIKKIPEIACVTTLKMNSVEKFAVSCLVIGTEDGDVIFLDPLTYSALFKAKLCNMKRTPYQMVSTGLYTVDYRMTVATREKCVCLLKRDWTEGCVLFSTDEHIVAIEVMSHDHSVVVICSDNTMACYNKKGKKQWQLNLEHRPVSMTLVPIVHLGMTLTAVALASGHLHFYEGKARRDSIFVRDVASVIKFGQLGQEEHVLIIITGEGNLMLKILKRTADFNTHAVGAETVVDTRGQRPWLIPKKSKLFLEQSVRERENAVGMHESFQLELNRFRLAAGTALLDAHRKSDNSIGAGALEPVRMAAEVEGLGPVFVVTLTVENSSAEKAVTGLSVLFHVRPSDYKISKPHIKVPLLPPGGKLKFPTRVEEVFEGSLNPAVWLRGAGGAGGVEGALLKVLLLKAGARAPVLAATLQMPPTDPFMIPYDLLTQDLGEDMEN